MKIEHLGTSRLVQAGRRAKALQRLYRLGLIDMGEYEEGAKALRSVLENDGTFHQSETFQFTIDPEIFKKPEVEK